MSKKSDNSSASLANLDLEGLVKEAREAKEQVSQVEEPASVEQETQVEDKEEVTDPPEVSTASESWDNFLGFLNTYRSSKTKDRPRSFYIEKEIIDVLENCSIANSKTTDVINGILRSFIDLHKANFREALRPRPTLISLD